MRSIQVEAVAFVSNARSEVEDDHWAAVVSEITLVEGLDEDSLEGIDAFSHVEVIFHFDRVDEAKIVTGARHPRNNTRWPKVGIFAQRGKNRPNRIGLCTARLIERRGRTLVVEGLDAIDGTPVIDIKPVMQEFLPRGAVTQPRWAGELMLSYW
ncbi:MAG: SAM-dependent methyltransferase [Burkholderiales bacterium]